MTSWRVWIVSVAALSAMCLGVARAEPLSLSQAINKAGRQRMLSQRIVKYYCLVGLGIDVHDARAELRIAIERFESQMFELRASPGDASVTPALDRVEVLWRDFDGIAGASIHREGARRLAALGEELLMATDAVVLALEALSQRPYARLVNISGRQRMLSQRMVKLYLLQAWGLGTVTTLDQMDRARNEFRGALSGLQSSAENTAAIDRQLLRAVEQWQWLEGALRLGQQGTYFPGIVDDAAEKTLIIMERLTALYARLYEQRVAPLEGNQ